MVITVYSCFNNYDLLGHVIENYCNYGSNKILLVDDHSDEPQFAIGCEMARSSNGTISIIRNQGKGIQSAISTAFNVLDRKVEWIYFPQQDVYPETEEFLKELDNKLQDLSKIKYKGNNIGALGFEIIDRDERHSKKSSLGYLFLSDNRTLIQSSSMYQAVKYYCLNMLGTILSGSYRFKRFRNTRKWLSDVHYKKFDKVSENYHSDFPIELPIWVAVCINRKQWEKSISIDPEIIFHMWFNDIAMQFLINNVPIYVTRDLRIINHQSLKEKFGFNRSSADAGKKGDLHHVEEYGDHLKQFYQKWGFDYEDVRTNFPVKRYSGTLVEKFFYHDPSSPINL